MAEDVPRGNGAELEIRISADLYSVDTVKRAAYRLIDRASADIRPDGSWLVCRLLPIAQLTDEDAKKLERDFHAEILDQDLRQTIGKETEAIRNAILAFAFSRTGLQSE